MTLERLTQITSVGIASGITLNSATLSGVTTLTTLSASGNISGVAGTFTDSVTVGVGLSVFSVSTFTNGPIFIGSGTSTGTATQPLQVTGSAYVSGNLGIGTTNPTSELHLYKNENTTNAFSISNINSGNAARSYLQLENDQFGSGAIHFSSSTYSNSGDWRRPSTFAIFTSGSNTAGGIAIAARNTSGYIDFYTGGNTQRAIITSTGNVGIGTTNPVGQLNVLIGPVIIGSGTSTGTASQRLQVTGGAYISGNLGIGTTNPQFPLDVVTSDTSAYAQYIRMRNSYNDYGFIGFRDKTGSEDLVQIGTQRIAANVGELLLYTNNGSTGQERIRVGAAGTVTLRAAGGAVINGYNADDNQLDIAKLSRMGYATSYRNLIIGKHLPNSTSVAYQSISLNYDPNTNASGSFAGYGNEIFVPNNNQTTSYYTRIKQPNTTNNNFKDLIVFGPNGEIMTPNSPAFFAKCNSSGYVTTSPMQFTSVDVNIGSCYDSSTYRFTAPLAATYYFVATAYINAGNTVNDGGYIRFHVNGGGTQYAYAGPGSSASPNGHLTVTVTKVVTLSANDYVDVRFLGYGTGTYYAGPSETTFAGYLLR